MYLFLYNSIQAQSICEAFTPSLTLCEQYPNLPVDEVLSGNYTNSVNRQNKVLQINGLVTFRGGCNLILCKLIASPGSKLILINDANTCLGCPPVALKQYRFLATKMYSCSHATWEGIEANVNTLVEFSNNAEIEGANVGIRANSGSNLRINNSKFWDNKIGIYALGNVTVLGMKGNLFSSRSDGPETNTVSLTGIKVAGDPALFNIGGATSNTGYNKFKYLYTGIKIINSNVVVSNSKFINNIHGIFAGNEDGTSSHGEITINGISDGSETFCNNTASDVITINSYNLDVINCKSHRDPTASIWANKSWIGINVSDSRNTTINIHNCKWETFDLQAGFQPPELTLPVPNAIILYQNCTNISGSIEQSVFNDIRSSKWSYPILFTNVTGNGSYNILNNKIKADYTTEFTCYFSNCKNINITGFNKIERSGSPYPAIHIFYGDNIRIFDNTIHDDLGTGSSGIRIEGTTNATLCDNKLDQCYTGIQVEGTASKIMVGSNIFGDNNIGLYYLNGTLTNIINEHKMNNWSPTAGYYQMAVHEGITYRSNKYLVRKDNYGFQTPIYNPSSNMKTPSDESWFDPLETGSPNYCNALPVPNPDDRVEGFTPLGDPEYRRQLTDGQLWDSDKAFYKFAVEHPATQLPASLENLFNNISQTNIPSYIEVAKMINFIYANSADLQTALNLVNAEIAAIHAEIMNQDNIMEGINPITGLEDEYLHRQNLSAELITKQNLLDQILEEINDEYTNDLNAAIYANNALTPVGSKQSEEKLINSLYLKYLSGGQYSREEISTLHSLSERCIVDHGNTVLYAQSLLPISNNYYREPQMFCNPAPQSPLLLRITNSVHLSENEIFDRIEIYSLDGRYHGVFTNLSIVELKTMESTLSGLYILKCKDAEGMIYTHKILL